MLTSEFSLGMREDGMKGQSFLGMLMGGGLGYSTSDGYIILSNGELLLSDTTQVQEWGISSTLAYDSNSDGLGVLLNLVPAFGQSGASQDSALWDRNIIDHKFDSSMHTDGVKVNAEIGYGMRIWEGSSVFTPYSRVNLTQSDDEVSLGGKLNIDTDIQFEIKGSRVYQEDGVVENGVNFDSSIKW